ncbi:MAG: asparagine synthase (glutamine-hydrolyzing) [Eubacterium sp.]|nr:asparagine synthase (glutamine-hydrolyzing) [Eubacterium sp.]MBR0412439.1 asparagine synthase (glutamine-hydrolyzing) [Eubacterium sp.]
MCGIAGILSDSIDLRNEKECIFKISRSLRMRGPDAKGEYILPNAALIHRRLAVIDVDRGAQPMHFGKYTIVYNGELYNTDEVRRELEALGYEFETDCDTEVVLKAFHMWRERSAEKFNGIFAYGVYDEKERELFLCRDRIGVKPLYWAQVGDTFAFSSRMESLLYVKGVEPVCSREGLCEIFMLGPAKTIGKTVFKQIRELPPASYMYYKRGRAEVRPYWQLTAQPFGDSEVEAQEHTHYLVSDAIRRQLVSDVPLCTFLSGGLDSSIISEVAADHYRDSGRELSTYSVDYVDNDRYFEASRFQPNKDSDYINLISDYIGSEHHNVVLDNAAVAEALIDATLARSCPGFTDVDSSLLLFCKEVKKDYTVCLSGECADEIFGGYPWYHRSEILFENAFPWARSTAARRGIMRDGFLPEGEEYVSQAYSDTVKNVSKLADDTALEKRMREMFVLNMNWFMQTLLVRKDVMSMESSLEVRVPFCDWRIVEYAYNMPWNIKAYDGREKGILRKAFEYELPEIITWRKKSPYPKTFNPVYLREVCKMLDGVLDDKSSSLFDMVDADKIRTLMREPESMTEPWYGQLMRTPQVLAYVLQIYVWMRKYNVEFEY